MHMQLYAQCLRGAARHCTSRCCMTAAARPEIRLPDDSNGSAVSDATDSTPAAVVLTE